MRNYIFDLDGTLIDSSEEILDCLKKAFEKSGCKIEDYKFTPDIIGPPVKQIIEHLAPELTKEGISEEIMKTFRLIYDNNENDMSKMYKGVYEQLRQLKACGKRLFIATFKPKIPTMRLVKKFALDMFDDIYTIDKFQNPITKAEMIEDIIVRYGLDRAETVMIGDVASDVLAAKAAGITGVGVLWGYGSDKSELIRNADYVLNRIEEIECQKLNYQII